MTHGPFRERNECNRSPSGRHCWHRGKCCWCGTYRDIVEPWITPHIRYIPPARVNGWNVLIG